MQSAAALRTATPPRIETLRFARPALRDVNRALMSCTGCNIRKICMPVEIEPDAQDRFDRLVSARLRLRKGDVLFRAGDRFTALYAIRLGSCKTVTLEGDGYERLSGHHLPGDIIGIEGMGNETYTNEVVALEDSEVCVLPFDRLEALAHDAATFQRRLYSLMAGAITRERGVTLMLSTMRAEQRLASFLLGMSGRYQLRGYSSTEFILRMTREEIGSHLGLKLETVSRLFSHFHEERLIEVRGRVIKLLDRPGLQQLLRVN